jgi:hypothetical protein
MVGIRPHRPGAAHRGPGAQGAAAPADTQKETADDGRLFIADIDAIRDVWSVPSAFAAYRDYLLGL